MTDRSDPAPVPDTRLAPDWYTLGTFTDNDEHNWPEPGIHTVAARLRAAAHKLNLIPHPGADNWQTGRAIVTWLCAEQGFTADEARNTPAAVALRLVQNAPMDVARRDRQPAVCVSKVDTKHALAALAIACGARGVPFELEIEAFGFVAEKVQPDLVASWEQTFGFPFPRKRADWFRLLAYGGIPADLFIDGKIRPHEVLNYVEGKLAALSDEQRLAATEVVTLNQAATLASVSKCPAEGYVSDGKLSPPAARPSDKPKTYTIAALRELTGLSNATLNKYAKAAGVRTAGRGQRGFCYTAPEVRAILQKIIDTTSEKALRERCRNAMKSL